MKHTLTVDDTKIGNIDIVELLRKYNALDRAIFFASFNDDNDPEKIVRTMAGMGANFGSHTVSHPHLTKVSVSRLDYELRQSKKMIEEITRKPCTKFSYPFGDFDLPTAAAVAMNGYTMARTCNKEGTGNYDVPSFYLDGQNWDEARKTDLEYYHLHWDSINNFNSWEALETFVNWILMEGK